MTVSSHDPTSVFAELSSSAAEAEIAPVAASAAALKTIAVIDAFLLMPPSSAFRTNVTARYESHNGSASRPESRALNGQPWDHRASSGWFEQASAQEGIRVTAEHRAWARTTWDGWTRAERGAVTLCVQCEREASMGGRLVNEPSVRGLPRFASVPVRRAEMQQTDRSGHVRVREALRVLTLNNWVKVEHGRRAADPSR